MDMSWIRPELLLVPAIAPFGYVFLYCALRAGGKISVNAAACHAGGLCLGRRVVIGALAAFGFFHPLMRLESALVRALGGAFADAPREQAVSEVVVEVVPMA